MLFLVQKIELQRQSSDSNETVRGHIVISLISRDRGSASPRNAEVSDFATALSADDSNELPEGSDLIDIFFWLAIAYCIILAKVWARFTLLHLCQARLARLGGIMFSACPFVLHCVSINLSVAELVNMIRWKQVNWF